MEGGLGPSQPALPASTFTRFCPSQSMESGGSCFHPGLYLNPTPRLSIPCLLDLEGEQLRHGGEQSMAGRRGGGARDLLEGLSEGLCTRVFFQSQPDSERICHMRARSWHEEGPKPGLCAGSSSQAFPFPTPPPTFCQRLPKPKMVLPTPYNSKPSALAWRRPSAPHPSDKPLLGLPAPSK